MLRPSKGIDFSKLPLDLIRHVGVLNSGVFIFFIRAIFADGLQRRLIVQPMLHACQG